MEPVNKYPEDFFDRYKEKPEELFEYGPEIQTVADKYLNKTRELLRGLAEVEPIGSVAYKIPASDIEIAVYPLSGNFLQVVEILVKEFGKPMQEQAEFVRFQVMDEKYEMNIHVYQGYEELVSKNLTQYMLERPQLIEEYKELKEKHSHSKREYQLEKNKFINKVIEQIPEDYKKNV